MELKVGMLIMGNNDKYFKFNRDMKKGLITNVYNKYVFIKIMDHSNKNYIGREGFLHKDVIEENDFVILDNDKKNIKSKLLRRYINTIYINKNKKTVVIDTPNGKYKATCSDGDYFDPFVGLCIAICNSLFGKNQLKKWLNKKIDSAVESKENKVIKLNKE